MVKTPRSRGKGRGRVKKEEDKPAEAEEEDEDQKMEQPIVKDEQDELAPDNTKPDPF